MLRVWAWLCLPRPTKSGLLRARADGDPIRRIRSTPDSGVVSVFVCLVLFGLGFITANQLAEPLL